MKLTQKIKCTILRSESAYNNYIGEKKYYQALRIKYANDVLYSLLQEYLYECPVEYRKQVIEFIFHLEDWNNQFISLQTNAPQLNEVFVFERLQNSPPYPQKIVDKFKNEKL